MPEYLRKDLLALNNEDFRNEVTRALTKRVSREYSQLVADVFVERWEDLISGSIGGHPELPATMSFGLVAGAASPVELTGPEYGEDIRRNLIDHLKSARRETIDESVVQTAEFLASESLVAIYMALQKTKKFAASARLRSPVTCIRIGDRLRAELGRGRQNERSGRLGWRSGTDESNFLHIVSRNMQNITPDKFFRHLRQLDSALRDDQLADLMLDTFPQACRLIREALTDEELVNQASQLQKRAVEEMSPTAESKQQAKDQGILELIEKYSPAEYFAWFDEKFDHLPRQAMIEATTKWLVAQVGKEYAALEANKQMASGTTARLNKLGLGVICGNSHSNEDADRVARLRCKAHPKYAEGVFFLRTVGANTADYAYGATIPSITLRPLPPDKRRKF